MVNNKHGFTLVEISVYIVVISSLFILIFSVSTAYSKWQKQHSHKEEVLFQLYIIEQQTRDFILEHNDSSNYFTIISDANNFQIKFEKEDNVIGTLVFEKVDTEYILMIDGEKVISNISYIESINYTATNGMLKVSIRYYSTINNDELKRTYDILVNHFCACLSG